MWHIYSYSRQAAILPLPSPVRGKMMDNCEEEWRNWSCYALIGRGGYGALVTGRCLTALYLNESDFLVNITGKKLDKIFFFMKNNCSVSTLSVHIRLWNRRLFL